MSTEIADCSKCLKPKSTQKPKGCQKNARTKEPPTDLEPSKAWIKNLGAGTTSQMPKLRTAKRDKSLVTTLSATQTRTPSRKMPTSTSTASTTKNESVTTSKTSNNMQSDLDLIVEKCRKIGDSTMVSMRQINDASEMGEPAKSGEPSIGNVTCDNGDNDDTNYQTCIELDTTVIDASKAETIDSKPISATPTRTKPDDLKTEPNLKHFSLELNTVLEDETSLYDPMDTMDTMEWLNARMKDPEKLAQDFATWKREYNEHFDDTIINETSANALDVTIKPSRAHELSIPLAPFDFPSCFPSSLSSSVFSTASQYDIKPADMMSSLPLNSTTLPTNTFAETDNTQNDSHQMDLIKRKLQAH